MVVFNIVFVPFAIVYLDSLADAVGNVGLVDNGIALILFIGEN